MPRYPRNKISDVVAENLPDFVVQDHPVFVTFVEEYYKWLESQDNSYFAPMSLLGTVDIDQTTDDFVKYFKNEVFKGFPDNYTSVKGDALDLRSVLKRVRSFYLAKGSESSIKFLMRALFDVYSEVYIPSTDILNASGGRWIQPTVVRCIDGDPETNRTLRNTRVLFINSDSVEQGSATITDIKQFKKDGTPILELDLSSVIGTVSYPGKVISRSDQAIQFNSQLLSMVSGVTFADGGSNYKLDDLVVINTADGYSGKGAKASVEAVTKTGTIRSIRIDDPGLNYFPIGGSLVHYSVTVDSITGTGASGLLITTNPKVTRTGYWTNNDGKISSTEKLQDNYRYQIHSYVVRTEANLSEYKDTLKELAHPSGKLVLGDYFVYRKESATASTGGFGLLRDEMPKFANYFPYTIAEVAEVSNVNGIGITCTNTNLTIGVLPGNFDLRGVYVNSLSGGGLVGDAIDYFPYGYNGNIAYSVQGDDRDPASSLGAGLSSGWNSQNFNRFGGIGATQEFFGKTNDVSSYVGSTLPGWPSNNIDWWIVHPHPNTWHGAVTTDQSWRGMTLQNFILGPYTLTSPPEYGASYGSQGTQGSIDVPNNYGQDL